MTVNSVLVAVVFVVCVCILIVVALAHLLVWFLAVAGVSYTLRVCFFVVVTSIMARLVGISAIVGFRALVPSAIFSAISFLASLASEDMIKGGIVLRTVICLICVAKLLARAGGVSRRIVITIF